MVQVIALTIFTFGALVGTLMLPEWRAKIKAKKRNREKEQQN